MALPTKRAEIAKYCAKLREDAFGHAGQLAVDLVESTLRQMAKPKVTAEMYAKLAAIVTTAIEKVYRSGQLEQTKMLAELRADMQRQHGLEDRVRGLNSKRLRVV